MTLKITFLLLVGILNIILALLVLVRDPRKLINVAFFILALSCAAWVLGVAGFYLVDSVTASLAWAKFYYAAPLVLVAVSVIVADLFPASRQINPRKLWIMLLGLGVLVVPLVGLPHFLLEELAFRSWGKEVVLGKPEYALYAAYVIGGFCWMLLTIAHKTRIEHGIYRTQAQVFFYGTLLSALLGTFFNLFLPLFGNYQLIWVGPLATSIYLITTLYSIVRHRLFDIRLIIARSIGYLLAVIGLVTIYGIVVFVVTTQIFQADDLSFRQGLLSATLAIVLAFLFRPVKRFFDRITNSLFYRDAYDPQAYIDKLNHTLVSTIDLDKLLKEVALLVQGTLKAQFCSLIILPASKHGYIQTIGTSSRRYTGDVVHSIGETVRKERTEKIAFVDYLLDPQEHRLQAALLNEDIAVVGYVGSPTKDEPLGYIVLGHKRSGNPYNSQDKKMLNVTVNELVIAIQNALRFQEIQNFTITLQEKVDQATRKLRQTNERLRTLDQTKDDFISMASHQLRTPLTSVKGYVSMVLDGDAGKISSLQRKLLNQSFISSQRMVYLIADLLNVSRLRTGKFIIEAIPSNLARVIEEEVSQLKETAKGRDLELMYHKPEHFPTLMLDETKLRQVIMNFIDNAIYYTPSGGKIEVVLLDKPQTIECLVIDNGMGVPKREQPHLFSKFFRAHNAKRARPDGTGLGLFMAKKVIIAQGGAIIFKSQEDKGSTFGFTFAKEKLRMPPAKTTTKPKA